MKTQSPRPDSAADAGSGAAASRSSGQAPGPSPDPDGARDESAAEALKDAGARLAEIKAYVFYYFQAQADRLKLAAREAVFGVMLAPVALLLVPAIVIVAVVLLLVGLANGIGGALGNRIWLGDIIVAVAVLVTVPFVARLMVSRLFGFFRKQTVEKYESRKLDQHARFGHDVNQRARQSDR